MSETLQTTDGWPPSEPGCPPEIVHLLRRRRTDLSPRATLVLGWGGGCERAFSLWAGLGAIAVDDPREATDAPLIDGVELICWRSPGEGWMATIWGPGRDESGCLPASSSAICLPDGPWMRCLRMQRQLAVIISPAPGSNGRDRRRRGAILASGLDEIGVTGPLLGARITAVSGCWRRSRVSSAMQRGRRPC